MRDWGRPDLVEAGSRRGVLVAAVLASTVTAGTPADATASSRPGHEQVAEPWGSAAGVEQAVVPPGSAPGVEQVAAPWGSAPGVAQAAPWGSAPGVKQAVAPSALPAGVAAAGRLSLRASRRFVFLGQRVRLRGRLTRNGRPLAGRLIRLRVDPYPFGNGSGTLASARTGRDGRFWFLGPPKRNTRFRVTAPGSGTRSRSVLVHADYSGRERHRWRRGRLRMGFTIFAPFNTPGPPGGEEIHFYLTQNGQSTMPRVASTRMRRIGGGQMRGRAVARTRRPQQGEHVWVCWREETSDGFGPPNPLDAVCGDDSVTTPPPP